jgi:hypothetical protein
MTALRKLLAALTLALLGGAIATALVKGSEPTRERALPARTPPGVSGPATPGSPSGEEPLPAEEPTGEPGTVEPTAIPTLPRTGERSNVPWAVAMALGAAGIAIGTAAGRRETR